MNKYIYIFFGLIICGLSSCREQKNKLAPSLAISQSFDFSDSFNVIYLSNNNDNAVSFELEINDVFPLKMTNIVQAIEDSSFAKNTSIDEEAWRYVSRSTFWANPISLENWQHNPILFLNSIGGGFCDDRASVLAAIWKNWFDSVRVVGLNGHVVSEVYNDNKWKMYDADLKVAYLNAENQVCSVVELEDSSQFVSSPHRGKVIGNNPVCKTTNPTSKRFSNFYKSKEDNEDGSSWHLNSEEPIKTFTLPAHATLKIEINKSTRQTNLSVILNETSKGKIEIPFVPYSAEGAFEYQLDTKNISFENDFYLFPTNRWIQSIQIHSVKAPSVIRYLVNPKLKFFQAENSVKIKSSLPLEISKKYESVSSYLPFELNSGLFFNEQTAKHLEFLAYLSNYSGKIDEKFMKKEYDSFLNIDNTLTTTEKVQLRTQFDKDLNELKINLKGKEFTILEDLYPQSCFYFFIASKNKKIDFVKSLLLEHL